MYTTKSVLCWFLCSALFGLSLLKGQTVTTVTPIEYPNALTNPLMGFRPDSVGNWNAKPYTTIARHYISWNEINNSSTDGVQKIIDFCNAKWAGCEAANVKIIPRVILDWNGGEYWPSYLTKGDYKSQKTRDAVVKMIAMLGQAWDNDPRVAWVQTGIVGKWGEQETPNVNTPMVAPDNATWASIMGEAFEAAFPNKMQLVRNQTDWTNEGFTEMGVYWDSFGRKGQYEGAWKDILKHNELGRYLVAPVEGEIVYNSSVVAAYMGSSPNATLSNPTYYNYLIDAIKQTHCSGLGWISIYTPGPTTNAGANLVQKAFGYRFKISEFSCSARTEPGSTLTLNAKVKNIGSAVMFENYPVAFVLVNELTRQIVYQSVISGTDIRTWKPGSNYDWDPMSNTNGSRVYLNPPTDNLISASISIPSNIAPGQYLAGITILEPSTNKPGIFFAVPNFFKQSQTQPLCRIGIGADATSHSLAGVPFDDLVNDDARYYTSTGGTNFALSTSATAGGTIAPGSGSYSSGTVVTVTATANSGFVFSGWSGALSGTTNPTTITMNAAKSVTANFTAIPPTTFALTTSASAGGTISPGSGTYNSGTVVTVTATPNAGFTFSGWSGALSGTTNPTTITMNAAKSVTANFTAIPTYTLSTNATAGGTIAPGSGSYISGAVVTVTATANSGFVFSGWSGDLSGSTNPTTITMNAAKSVTANFTAITYTLTTTASAGGTIAPG